MRWDADNWKDLEFMMYKPVTVDLLLKPWGKKNWYCYNVQQAGSEVQERDFFTLTSLKDICWRVWCVLLCPLLETVF